MRAEYENLLLQFESQVSPLYAVYLINEDGILSFHIANSFLLKRTTSEIQIDYLTRRLAEATNTSGIDEKAIQLPTVRSLNEVETNLVIEQLQEKVESYILSL